MKTLLTLIFLASTFSMVGCHNKATDHLNELLSIVGELGYNQASFFEEAGIGDGDQGDFSLEDYHPDSGNNRLVMKHTSHDGDHNYYGLDMTGVHDVLFDLKNMNDAEKETALIDFVEAGFVDELYRLGLSKGAKFYELGSSTLFSETNSFTKDLESIGAKIEMNSAEDFSEELIADYGLSEQRAHKVAKTINAYKKLVSKRSLTNREQNAYSQELLGVDYKKARGAIMEGKDFDRLMEKAAEKNGTSPEQISAIIREKLI